MHHYYTYLVASKSGVLYVGMTNNLERRMFEHKAKRIPGFTAKYNVDRLVWNQMFRNVWEAIAAEKRIKGWSRAKKIALIEEQNPTWADLSKDWPGLAERVQEALSSRGTPRDLGTDSRPRFASSDNVNQASFRPEIPRSTSE
jgi:putative endonuclease